MREKVPQQDIAKRVKNFFEVALGFSKAQAEKEASRCLQCKNAPCVKGCPVEIDIPAFIKLIKAGMQREALEKIKEKNNLPAVCGRVCPQEDQCEAACVLNKKKIPINIGALERYASEYNVDRRSEIGDRSQISDSRLRSTNYELSAKIAVVGSGPAGLTAAADLAKMGYKVALFESLHIPGGVLAYGIPEFRMPKKQVESEVEYIKSLGVILNTDVLIGASLSIDDLFREGFKAICIAAGAGLPQFLGIPGENLKRVYSANEFLTRINLMKAYQFPEYSTPLAIGKSIAVIGGGNVALDAARCALRLGSKAILVYRRTEKEMPARIEEIAHAEEEGVVCTFLTQPVQVLGDERGFVSGLECIKMELGEPDESGRRRPIPVAKSNFTLEVTTVIVAIGQNPNPLLTKMTPALKSRDDATVVVDENLMTSIPGVFAAGDIVSGADTVISAMGQAKKAAVAIDRYLTMRKA